MADHRINILLNVKQKGVKLIGSMLGKLKSGISGLAALARKATFALGAAFGVGAFFVKAAADAEEAESKFAAVFKELTATARDWSEDFAKSVNRSGLEIRTYMSTLQDTFVPMGFARDKAAEFSKEITKLAIDLASFNNIAEPEVLKALQSALVGNVETVRRFGIVLNEQTVVMEAVRQGWIRNAKQITNAQKIQARMILIQRGSKDAMGDAERTAGSFTNRIKGLAAAFKDYRVEVGAQLIKGAELASVVDKITGKVREFTRQLINGSAVENWAATSSEAIQNVATALSALFGDDAGKRKIAIVAFKDIGANFMQVVRDGLLKSAKLFGNLVAEGFKASFKFGVGSLKEQAGAASSLFQKRAGADGGTVAAAKGVADFASKFFLGVGREAQEAEVSKIRKAQLASEGVDFRSLGGTSAEIFKEMIEKMDEQIDATKDLKQKG